MPARKSEKIRKAVITAAGLGTRFLPATKAIPKEMLPIVDKPLVQYAVEEAVASGISEIVIVIANRDGRGAIQDHFAPSNELEKTLANTGKHPLLEAVRNISRMANIKYAIQEQQLGLGHAILMSKRLINNEAFAVILPDDVIVAKKPALKQLMDVYYAYKAPVVAVQRVPSEKISAYGVIKPEQVGNRTYRVLAMVEKPMPDKAPSNFGIVGRYLLTPAIFEELEKGQKGALGEIQLTDGMNSVLRRDRFYAYEIEGTRYDTGTPLGLLKASISLGLGRKDIGKELKAHLQALLAKMKS